MYTDIESLIDAFMVAWEMDKEIAVEFLIEDLLDFIQNLGSSEINSN